ncbi:ARM repeat-containing protein [Microthyrium microscopicum]|uniref:ARM repeat-containing protein n=1 Tax=Microthyrium microscopicum TaxID=703497 RepID=A0A6A6U7H9_9PEZI|nr:ARM repeat-containing protein [Microthyrium microscopicum]
MAEPIANLSEAGLIQALEVVYNPRSKNETRQEATIFLDQAKQSPEALTHGYLLASDSSRPAVLRHYGMSMMLFYLKHVYTGGNEQELKGYVLNLTESLLENDPSFLKNKVVQIWTEVAKRIWGQGWDNMDEQLVNLWRSTLSHKEFVLLALEQLSEDIFSREDYVAALRSDLGSSFARICVTEAVMKDHYLPVQDAPLLRSGKEGWLQRICLGLNAFLEQHSQQPQDAQIQACIVRSLGVIQSFCVWISPQAIITSRCVEMIGSAFASGDTAMRMAAMDAFISIFNRNRVNIETAEMEKIIGPIFNQGSLQLLHEAYGWAKTAGAEEDDEKYSFAKKLSEVLASLGVLVEINPDVVEKTGNLPLFFSLLLEITTHPSLLVSLPVLDVWLRLLRSRTPQFTNIINESMGALLELCTSRALKFDSLSEDSGNATVAFLASDCDTVAQRELILGQYRTACVHTIEIVVRRVPLDAMKHILDEAATFFHSLSSRPFSRETYSKPSPESLQADTHFTAIEAGSRGCLKWLATHVEANNDSMNQAVDAKGANIEIAFGQWCDTALTIPIQDPDISRKMIAQIVSLTSKVLSRYPQTALTILDRLLDIRGDKNPSSQSFKDATKELLETCAFGAQRLATTFADTFLGIYDQLESRIQQILNVEGADLQTRWMPFMLMIIHRASNLDAETRTEKLRRMIQPVKEAWESPALHTALTDYSSFCNYLGWDRLPDFLHQNNFYSTQEWSEKSLGEDGLRLQQDLLDRNDQIPIKMTKALLHATTEKLEEGSPIFEIACTVWGEIMPVILPNLLKMLSYATSFHSNDRWTSFPGEIQAIVRRILTDRFWQNGISAESRDAFVSKVNNTKTTFEGFGSTVRRTVRQIRTGACDLLMFFSKLGDVFYGIPELAPPLSQALYEGAASLSAHHFAVLITFSSNMIKGCPTPLRAQFLPPILANLFQQLKFKVDTEWDVLNRRTEEGSADDNLDDEMKNQSILRSMTYNGCYLLFTLTNADLYKGEDPTPLSLITTDVSILEPVLTFTASALRVRDFHSVKSTCVILHDRIIPLFRDPGAVHDYICNDLLKAAISSIHEPYFVDLQKDLASLIVQIITLDSDIAGNVIASLPGLSSQPLKVHTALERVRTSGNEKIGRALVLELLEHLRGVSIHEMGRIGGPKKSRNQARLLQQFDMQAEPTAVQIERGGSPGLEGVADLLQ